MEEAKVDVGPQEVRGWGWAGGWKGSAGPDMTDWRLGVVKAGVDQKDTKRASGTTQLQ